MATIINRGTNVDRTKGGCSHCDVTHWFVKSYLQAQDWCFRTTLFKNKLCDKDKASCKVQPTKQVKFLAFYKLLSAN